MWEETIGFPDEVEDAKLGTDEQNAGKNCDSTALQLNNSNTAGTWRRGFTYDN